MARPRKEVPDISKLIGEDGIDLPEKKLLRVGEVADYFSVTDRTVYLWIEHGHLKTELTPAGQMRVTRESVDKCRFKEHEIA